MAGFKKNLPLLNGSSLADIAFIMLAFFLLTGTMDQNKGISRRLPPMPTPDQEKTNIQVNKRNNIQVSISSSNRIFAGGRPISDVSELNAIIVEYITNPTDDPNLPERKVEEIEGFGPYPVSKGIISLLNDRQTSYDIYISVQNELIKAVNQVRDAFSMQHYGRKYAEVDETKQGIVRKAIPAPISEAEPKDVTKR